jgi:Spy/CpxP family protein refolding chaperone
MEEFMKVLRWIMMVAVAVGIAAGNAAAAEKTAAIESVQASLEEGLGLTAEQKAKLRTVRDDFKARQQVIRRDLNAKNEALRQGLDAEAMDRAKVDAVAAEIKLLQGQLLDNRVDVVFKLREIYTPEQIKTIKARLEKARKKASTKKSLKKGKKITTKKSTAKKSAGTTTTGKGR